VDNPPIIDRERLILITRGDATLADEFLNDLIAEAGELRERLKTLIGSGDLPAVRDIAHTVKGMATELGIGRLRAAAAALEAETEPAQWPDHLNRIDRTLTELRDHLRT
jgi:HPt (histidine-containing phosphotransfer) domain-containing protein